MSGDSARLKGQSVHTAAGMHCCSNRGGCSATGWLWLEHHRAVTRGTSHFHANQCHGDPAAALWCKWVVTTHGDGDEVEERGDLGDFVKVEAPNSSFHATSIHPVQRVWSLRWEHTSAYVTELWSYISAVYSYYKMIKWKDKILIFYNIFLLVPEVKSLIFTL